MTFTESRPVPDLQLANKGGGGSNVSSRQNSLRQSSLRQNSVRVGGMKQGGGVEIVIPDDAPPNFEVRVLSRMLLLCYHGHSGCEETRCHNWGVVEECMSWRS